MTSKNLAMLLSISFVLNATTACAHMASSDAKQPYFADVDVYGTSRLSDVDLKEKYGKQIEACVQAYVQQPEKFGSCKKDILDKIEDQFHFAYADLSLIRYFKPEGSPIYATLDVVEPQDAPKRMTFLAEPKQHFDDPDGLIKAWDQYIQIGFELLAKGEISGQRPNCPAFHCIFGHLHPKLAPFEKIFVEGVLKNKAKLENIFLNSQDPHQRAAVAFLLPYEKDGSELVDVLSQRITDGNADVRNNITRVFSDIAAFHHELAIPVDKVIEVLDFPSTTDRNKASAVIFGIASNKDQLKKYRQVIMMDAVPILLKTLQLKQPNNHDFSFDILQLISGQKYGERDYDSWNKWYSDNGPAQPEIVYFPSGTLTLGGELYKPKGEGPFPAVLYNHGSAEGMNSSQASHAIGPLYAARGWIYFMPYRRGQGLSANAGQYIGDQIAAAEKQGGKKAAAETMIRLLTTDHLDDQLAGLAWLKNQNFVQSKRIAVDGQSFGGIETVLGAEKYPFCAAVDAAGGSMSWKAAPQLHGLMKNAVRNSQSPTFFFQAENDFDTTPSKMLAKEMKKVGKEAEFKIYPPFGKSHFDGHSFAWLGSAIWFDDVFNFVQENCSQ